MIVLIKAIDTYRPEMKVKFSTYASKCIQNEIYNYMRKEARAQQRDINIVSIEISEPVQAPGSMEDGVVSYLLLCEFLHNIETEGVYKEMFIESLDQFNRRNYIPKLSKRYLIDIL